MKIFYFSATGNSLRVAECLGNNVYSVVKAVDKGQLQISDEAIGFVFPTHFGQVPRPMISFLEKTVFRADYFFAITTYGHHSGDVLRQFVHLMQAKGCRVAYVNKVEMVDTWVPLNEVEKEKSLLRRRDVGNRLMQIKADIDHRGWRPAPFNLLLAGMTWIEKRVHYLNKCRTFRLDENCNGCGVCSKVCPEQNIHMSDKPHFGNQCISCLACVHLCSQRAIHVKGEKSNSRYHNPHVSLRQLIEANGPANPVQEE